MDYWQAIALGILQGATEFLPISSSGHLVLFPWVMGWGNPGLTFDTMVHWGTLAAVVVYFFQDLVSIIRDWVSHIFMRRPATENARLGWLLIAGTIPGVVMGLVGEDFFEQLFATPMWVAIFLLVTAAILTVSERLGKRVRTTGQLLLWEALLIGVAQGVAIAPGISRSGATIAMGLLLGLTRPAAARFSFLLSVPIVFGTGAMQLVKLLTEPASNGAALAVPILLGFLAAAISGYICIRFLLSYLQRGKLYPFAIYCTVVGIFGLVLSVIR
jgi:undecaprenyl-diphosphatase